jgi:multisubunit Na+/H+ antiporter MnhC subunit
MSNRKAAATAAAAIQPSTPKPPTAQLLAAVKDNFALVSAAAVLLGVTFSTMFLAAYLSVFDWHLLWFVQYSDILTFGLLAVGVITGSLTFIQSAAQTVLGLFGMKGRERWKIGIILFVLVACIMGFEMWGSIKAGHGYFHILMGVTVLGLAVTLIIQVMGYITTTTLPNLSQAFFLFLSLSIATVSLGQWLGYSVQESANGNEITLKDKTLNDMKVIMVMSRHTILLKEGMLYIVPTADILSFKVGDQFTPSKPADSK